MKWPILIVCCLLSNQDRSAVTLNVEENPPHVYELTIANGTDTAISVWRLGNAWGDCQFEGVFKNLKTGKPVICRCKKGYYNVHGPAKLVIKRESSKTFSIDLKDGKWSFDEECDLADLEWMCWIYTPRITSDAIERDIYLERLFATPSDQKDEGRDPNRQK